MSVKSKNFVPVNVLKHCMRKFSVSSTSRPDEGSALLRMPPGGVGGGIDLMGFNLAVMAWTLGELVRNCELERKELPVECAGEDEIIVCADLVEAAFVEAAVVD